MSERHLPGHTHQLPGHHTLMQGRQAKHFLLSMDQGVATVRLNRPERKNPLSFDSYAELRDLFRDLAYASDIRAVVLGGEGAREFLRWPEYREADGGVQLDPGALPAHRREFVGWLRRLLEGTRERPAFFGCFGLHEWAMVYGLDQAQVRHSAWPLRLSTTEIRDTVDEIIRVTNDEVCAAIAEAISYSGRGVTVVDERDLWDMPVVFLLFLAAVGTEWAYRRAKGLA